MRRAHRAALRLAHSQVWVALGAGVQAWFGCELAYTASHPTHDLGAPANWTLRYAGLVACATLVYYTLHRLHAARRHGAGAASTSRERTYLSHARTMALTAAAAGAFGLYLLTSLPSALYVPLALVAALGTLYSIELPGGVRLRRLGWVKPVWVAGLWTAVCFEVPSWVDGSGPQATGLLLSRFVFFVGLALVFDYRDREVDVRAGVRTAAVRHGPRTTRWLIAGAWVASVVLGVVGLSEGAPAHRVLAGALSVATAIGLGFWRKPPPTRGGQSDLAYDLGFDGLLVLPLLLLGMYRLAEILTAQQLG